jgi:PAS domain S-box-containing protein
VNDYFTAAGVAIRITAWYLCLGLCWVLVTDLVLYRIVHDPLILARLDTAKGWLFVGFSALCVFLITAVHVRRLRREQETKRAIVESIADGVILVDCAHRITDANPAAVRMLGVADRGSLIGMEAEEFARRFRACYLDGRVIAPREYVAHRALRGEIVRSYRASLRVGARTTIVSVTASPVRVQGGPVEMSVSVMRDITLKHKLDRIRDTFFGSAAHALKTPIAVLKGHTDSLWRWDDPRIVACARAMDRQTQRMELLVDNLMVLARLRDGSLRLHPHETQLAPLIDEVVRDMRSSVPENPLAEHITAYPSVFGDSERLSQAICNLIALAGRESARGSAIDVELTRAARYAQIAIRYDALPPAREPEEELEEYSVLSVERHVTEELAKAHAGVLTTERAEDGATTLVLELPAIGEEIHETA